MKEMTRVDKTLYMAYVHIYAGHVDSNYSKVESDYIKEKFGANIHKEAFELYRSYNLSEGSKFISDYIDILNEEDIVELKSSLKVLYHVDGNYCQYEKNFSEFMTKMLQYAGVS